LLGGFSVPLLILLVSAFRRDLERRRADLTTMIGYTLYVALASNGLAMHFSGSSYDPAFLRADAILGFNPISFADAIARHQVITLVLMVAYIALPLVIGLTWVLEQSLRMRRAVLIGGCLCFACYGLFPAVGPGHYDWANQMPIADSPMNCMPSMHLTWALLLVLNARSQWLRWMLCAYVLLIAVSTLALREHYLVDLLAAVPYTFSIQWISGIMEVKAPILQLQEVPHGRR